MDSRHILLTLLAFLAISGLVLAAGDDNLKSGTQGAFDAAKSKFAASGADLNSSINDLNNILTQLKAGNVTEGQALEVAKSTLTKYVDHMIDWLDVVEARVNGIQDNRISDADRTTLLNELASDKAALEQIKPVIQAAQNLTELNATRETIKTEWSKDRSLVKKATGIVLCDRALEAIGRINALSANITAKIAQFKSKGIDTSEFDLALATFNGKVSDAEQLVDQAKQKFLSIQTVQDAEKNYQDGVTLLQQARSSVRDALSDLKTAGKNLRDKIISDAKPVHTNRTIPPRKSINSP